MFEPKVTPQGIALIYCVGCLKTNTTSDANQAIVIHQGMSLCLQHYMQVSNQEA